RHDLSDVEMSLLWQCHRAIPVGQGQIELATAMSVSPAQISGLVEQLRERGLLAGCRDPRDRRRQVWQVTPAGNHLLEQVLVELEPLAAQSLTNWNDSADS